MKPFCPPQFRVFSAARPWLLACALLTLATLAQAQVVRGPLRLDDGSATVQDLYLAASGPALVSAAWITSDGPAPGIYLRNRNTLGTWQPIINIRGNVGEQPRDLTVAHDSAGKLHIIWTALDGGRRHLHHAVSDALDRASQATPLTFKDSAENEVEFPAVTNVPGLGMGVVWQANTTTATQIRAAILRDGAAPLDLGVVSGDSPSAIAPQIASAQPLRVAWYQIDEIGGRLALNEWAGSAWKATLAPLVSQLPQNGYVVLRAEANAVAAGWQDQDQAGVGKIALQVVTQPSTKDTTATTQHYLIQLPPGEQTQPSLDGDPQSRLAVAWRNFSTAGQEICIRSVGGDGSQSDSVVLSPPSQRFAGRVEQITVGDWSIVAWTDVARDGGTGGVYVSELNWQTPKSN